MKIEKKATMVQTKKTKELLIKITFPFSFDELKRVKTLSGRKYHTTNEGKFWTAPITIPTLKELLQWGYVVDDALMGWLNENQTETNIEKMGTGVIVPGLKGELFPFQKAGVIFIERKNGRVLIGDEMGLGKTIQALAWLQLHPEKRPVIIVVRASIKLNWEREIHNWMLSEKVQILHGTNLNKQITGQILIINYDILVPWVDRLSSLKPKVIITDECHYYKSAKAKRTKAVKSLCRGVPHVIALSGTPIVNRPIEIFNAVNIISPGLVGNAWSFAHRYCGAKHNGFGWDFNGATNTKELHDILSNSIMIRRLKKDVLKDLPDKLRSFLPMELDNWQEYNYAETDFIEFIRFQTDRRLDNLENHLKKDLQTFMKQYNIDGYEFEGHLFDRKEIVDRQVKKAAGAEVLSQIETLKQLAVRGKLEQSIEWIKDFLATGEKLVIFAVHCFVIDRLMEEFYDIAVKVDGSVAMNRRQQAVDSFQNNEKVKLFIGNIEAAGIGLTLTAASNVAFLELPWTPGEVAQAEDRCHRIGQKDSVTIHYLLAAGTIEQKIALMLDKKRKVLDAVLDGKDSEGESLLMELINEYLNI